MMNMAVMVMIISWQGMNSLVVRILVIIGSNSQRNRPSFGRCNMFYMTAVVVGERKGCGMRLCIIVEIGRMTLTGTKVVMRVESPCCDGLVVVILGS
jgi:hypothetical protein